MRIDVVSIFPEFFDVLDLSLIGRAQRDGLLQISRIQPRDFTTDRHRTVDSPPAGGGAGMVMKPEPVAQALEYVLEGAGSAARSAEQRPVLIIPTPPGRSSPRAPPRSWPPASIWSSLQGGSRGSTSGSPTGRRSISRSVR